MQIGCLLGSEQPIGHGPAPRLHEILELHELSVGCALLSQKCLRWEITFLAIPITNTISGGRLWLAHSEHDQMTTFGMSMYGIDATIDVRVDCKIYERLRWPEKASGYDDWTEIPRHRWDWCKM